MKDKLVIGLPLAILAATIGATWLLSRILTVCKNEMEDPIDFEAYKKRELDNEQTHER